VPMRAPRNIARVGDNGLYETSVADEDRQEKKVVNDEYGNGGSSPTRDQ
jgi:hypothetical protein